MFSFKRRVMNSGTLLIAKMALLVTAAMNLTAFSGDKKLDGITNNMLDDLKDAVGAMAMIRSQSTTSENQEVVQQLIKSMAGFVEDRDQMILSRLSDGMEEPLLSIRDNKRMAAGAFSFSCSQDRTWSRISWLQTYTNTETENAR